jgi:hypothetical protein
VSTRHHRNKKARQIGGAPRPRRRVRRAGRVLLIGALWIPPATLGAMLIAGPVSASDGAPTTAPHVSVPPVNVVAATPTGSAPCAVVLQPLPTLQTGGQPIMPAGPGTCLAPAKPSAPSGAGAVVGSDNQAVVTQSIGVSVQAG